MSEHGRGKARVSALCLAFLVIALLGNSAAVAGKSDEAWATCLWEQVPTSASNWLAMPLPKRDYGLKDVPPEYVLQFRLQAACHERLTPAGAKYPPSFSSKAVRKSLARLVPPAIAADRVDPMASRCTRYFLNDEARKTPAGFDWGFGRDTNQAQFASITYFFAAEKGGAVGLPPKGGLRRCAFIQPDGTFTDA